MGLISQAVARAPHWVLKKLIATYITLHLADIGKEIKISSEDEVRELLLTMVRSLPPSFILSSTYITLGRSNQTTSVPNSPQTELTFSDPPPQFTKEQAGEALLDVQQQTALPGYLE